MLLFTILLCVSLAPVLQGIWDFRSQFLFEAALFLSGGAWLLKETVSGGRPFSPTGEKALPLAAAALFALLAALLSPVRALVVPEWWSFAAGLFTLVLAGALSRRETGLADLALRCCAWFVAALGLYQMCYLSPGENISASLTNPNALAFFIILLLPLALAWRDVPLFGILVALLIRTHSAAALLSIVIAAFFYFKDSGRLAGLRKSWPAVSAALVLIAVLFAAGLGFRSVQDRLGWWGTALRMLADRPFFGFGAGSFAYVYPAYHAAKAGGMATIYAHNYYLEFLAENGFPAACLWFWAVLTRFRALRGPKKYAVIAGLAQSFVDFGLSVPGNFFIFCYLLAGDGKEAPEIETERRAPGAAAWAAAAAALGCFAVLCGVFSVQLKLERLREAAAAAVSAGDYASAEASIGEAERLAPKNPLVPALLGRIRLKYALRNNDRRKLFAAAVEFERALALDPYDRDAYRRLEQLYAAAGEDKLKVDLLRRERAVFPLME